MRSVKQVAMLAVVLIGCQVLECKQPALGWAMVHRNGKLPFVLIKRHCKVGSFLVQRMRPVIIAATDPVGDHFVVQQADSIAGDMLPVRDNFFLFLRASPYI